jgi:molybdopterin/thiamine biosynthesis adenylyltransferase
MIQFEDRFDRSIRAFTEDGQRQFAETHVCVVGCGGIGSLIGQQLARLGIGKLTLVDPDYVERSNLPRLPGATEGDLGRPKVEVLQHVVIKANPAVETTTIDASIQEYPGWVAEADLVMAGVDRVLPRAAVNQLSLDSETPYIDAGVRIDTDDEQIARMEGVVHYVKPRETACFHCLDRADPDDVYRERFTQDELEQQADRGYINREELEPTPAVIYLNGVVASLAVSVAVKHLLGYAQPPGLLRYDDLAMAVRAIETRPEPDCRKCWPQDRGPDRDLDLDTSQFPES